MSKFKVKCTGFNRHERYFTEGKVYVWEDGKLTNDNGYVYVSLACGPNISNWVLSDWYIFEKVCSPEKIIITHDGTTTLARMYNGNAVIKTATAKRCPEDTFDFEIGARLAMDRLIGEKPHVR